MIILYALFVRKVHSNYLPRALCCRHNIPVCGYNIQVNIYKTKIIDVLSIDRSNTFRTEVYIYVQRWNVIVRLYNRIIVCRYIYILLFLFYQIFFGRCLRDDCQNNHIKHRRSIIHVCAGHRLISSVSTYKSHDLHDIII